MRQKYADFNLLYFTS